MGTDKNEGRREAAGFLERNLVRGDFSMAALPYQTSVTLDPIGGNDEFQQCGSFRSGEGDDGNDVLSSSGTLTGAGEKKTGPSRFGPDFRVLPFFLPFGGFPVNLWA
jgi:hypothetical protein